MVATSKPDDSATSACQWQVSDVQLRDLFKEIERTKNPAVLRAGFPEGFIVMAQSMGVVAATCQAVCTGLRT
jgi:hypothetical protein